MDDRPFILPITGEVQLPGLTRELPPLPPPIEPPRPPQPPPPQPPPGGGALAEAPEALRLAIQRYFPQAEWDRAARVSRCESGWRTSATNDTRHLAGGQCNVRYYHSAEVGYAQTEYSLGQWQINLCAHPTVTEAQARDPDWSTAWAANLWRANGWWPWGCYAVGRVR